MIHCIIYIIVCELHYSLRIHGVFFRIVHALTNSARTAKDSLEIFRILCTGENSIGMCKACATGLHNYVNINFPLESERTLRKFCDNFFDIFRFLCAWWTCC